MPFLIIDGERYALEIGDTTVGGTGDGALAWPAFTDLPPHAIIAVLPDHSATISPVAAASVMVDGRTLAEREARVLAHGARIEVAGRRILFGDLRRTGSTSHVAGVTDEELAMLNAIAPGVPTVDSGGRLVATGDGREYTIPSEGLEIGRDPACGIVLESKEVSRHHATITPGLFGYAVTDCSANGVFVNGVRIDGSQVLGRGDVIRIGSESFRFEAQAASFEPDPELRCAEDQPAVADAASPTEPDAARPEDAAAPPPKAAAKVPAPIRPAPPLLATLEVINAGIARGTRYRIERQMVQIGRDPECDIALADDSVSAAHAALRRAAAGWVVSDLGSTNGTYLDGERVRGDKEFRGAVELRFGNVKMVFRPIAASRQQAEGRKGTRDIVALDDGANGSER